MRLIFLGSPEVATAPLRAIATAAAHRGHQLVAVVTQPARAFGRGRELRDPPVALVAREWGIPVLQPEKAGAAEFIDALATLAPDVAITAAYGQILTDRFLAVPKRATINIHPSLLPRYRGATPVPQALLAGDTETGVTILFTVRQLDAGAVILQRRTPIAADETAGPLTARLFALGGEMIWDALDSLRDPGFVGTPQDASLVTHCRKVDKEAGRIDWARPADAIVNAFRAYEPWPGSFTFHGGKRLALTSMRVATATGPRLHPGAVTLAPGERCLLVGSGEGVVRVDRLKPAGGKEMDGAGYWNGIRDRQSVVFTHGE